MIADSIGMWSWWFHALGWVLMAGLVIVFIIGFLWIEDGRFPLRRPIVNVYRKVARQNR